jgi:predicted RND superfamily exporter protein
MVAGSERVWVKMERNMEREVYFITRIKRFSPSVLNQPNGKIVISKTWIENSPTDILIVTCIARYFMIFILFFQFITWF